MTTPRRRFMAKPEDGESWAVYEVWSRGDHGAVCVNDVTEDQARRVAAYLTAIEQEKEER